jgi:hypothetical protein
VLDGTGSGGLMAGFGVTCVLDLSSGSRITVLVN